MRYKSCRLLEHGIYIYLDPGSKQLCVGHCCNTDNLELPDRLYMYSDLKNQTLDWNYVFEEKRKLRENAKLGIYPKQCDGCFELQVRDWDDENYINHLTAGHIMKCNSRCVYCPIGRIEECHNREQDVDFQPFIAELTEKNLLRYNGSLRFVGGEPTLMKEFDWLVDLFSKHNVPEIYVPTSAIRLSKSLCNALEKVESAAIVTSVDAGTKETFEKVKGTKFYDVVWKNLREYLKHARLKNFVIPKFILFTNYNDSASEVSEWLKLCKQFGFIEVQFDSEHSVSSSEFCENKKYVNRTLKMLKYAEMLSKLYNIKVTSYLAFMNRAKSIFEKQLKYYEEHKSQFKQMFVNGKENIDINSFYNDIYADIELLNDDFIKNYIEKIIEEERFSPLRRVFIEIKDTNLLLKYSAQIIQLLRLGFDFVIKVKKLNKNWLIDEILKTSNSQIDVMPASINDIFSYHKSCLLYKNCVKQGKITKI